MAEEQNPYLAVLADLERERDQLNETIVMMRKRAGLAKPDVSVSASGSTSSGSASEPAELRSDTFFGMVISEAIKAYLGIVKRPKTTVEIAKALEEGGLQHTSKSWYATVLTTLNRMEGNAVVRLPNGWGMTEWYPGRNFEKKPATPKRKKRKRASKRAKSKAAQADSGSVKAPSAMSAEEQTAHSRQLQGRYIGLLNKIPADKRQAYKEIAKRDGREKAVLAMKRDVGE